jgi:hypothetical protein
MDREQQVPPLRFASVGMTNPFKRLLGLTRFRVDPHLMICVSASTYSLGSGVRPKLLVR